MGFRIGTQEGLDTALTRIALERLDKALQALRQKGDPADTVHEVRKRCKEIRGLLRLYRGSLDSTYRQENHFFRDIGRILSQSRDRRVMIDTLGAIAGELSEAAALAELAPKDVPPAGAFDEVRRRLELARLRIPSWSVESSDFQAIEKGLKKTYRRAQKALREVERRPDPANLHELRKRVKYHRYHTQLLEALGKESLARRRAMLGELTDLLGEDHDIAVLAEHLTNAAGTGVAETTASTDRVLRWIDRRRLVLEQCSMELLAPLFAQRAREFAGFVHRLYGSESRSETLKINIRNRFIPVEPKPPRPRRSAQ